MFVAVILIVKFAHPLRGALAGKELIERAYQAAIEEGYRFYSFGDAMLIL